MGVDFKILRAYHGLERLDLEKVFFFFNPIIFSNHKVQEIYGKDMVLKDLNPVANLRGDRFICISFFDNMWPLLFAQIVQFKDSFESLKKKSYKEIQNDLNQTYEKHYVFWDSKGKTRDMLSLYYYKKMSEELDKYVIVQKESIEVLKFLKSKGKFLFVVTNSHPEYVGMTMDYSYGKVLRLNKQF